MEIKAKLIKPYNENERMKFIVEYNHKQGYTIEETDTELQALWYTQKELEEEERKQIDQLYLTGADVERAIYKVKGMDFDDIIDYVSINQPQGLDIKALKIELKANHFYRGNAYVSAIGQLLGFSEKQLDKFFKDGNYEHLINNEGQGET